MRAVLDVLREMDLGRVLLLEVLGAAALGVVLYLVLRLTGPRGAGDPDRRG
jgi:hypothetical protein